MTLQQIARDAAVKAMADSYPEIHSNDVADAVAKAVLEAVRQPIADQADRMSGRGRAETVQTLIGVIRNIDKELQLLTQET